MEVNPDISTLDNNNKLNFRLLARNISLVENEVPGFENILLSLPTSHTPIIGITGAPGAGKSSMTDRLIGKITAEGKSVAVLCIDPTSPFNKGALLGDRIRMSEWYNHPNVFIRSLGTRGALGGLHPRIIEVTELVRNSGFDYVIIETVGVGQSEVDIAGLADTTIVLLVPEGGDIIQTMKSGLMEIADIFVVNKSDRPGADTLFNNLRKMLGPALNKEERKIPVIKTSVTQEEGIDNLFKTLKNLNPRLPSENKIHLMAHKVFSLVQAKRMKSFDLSLMEDDLRQSIERNDFNLYKFARKYE